jgi:hypothetical protein
MRPLHRYFSTLFCLIPLTCFAMRILAQDSTKKDLIVSTGFYNVDNRAAWLAVHAKTKIDGRFQPVNGARFRLYLDKDSALYLIGLVSTNANGEVRTFLPPSLKQQWGGSPKHTFITISDPDPVFNASRTETPYTRARLQIDTAAGRTITATIQELKNGLWVPAKAVDIKIVIRRSGGDMTVGDKELYTTDSTGTVAADFKRDGLPGDNKGILTLVAKVEDNDLYGNLQTGMTVPWGSVDSSVFTIGHRTLWGTRFRTPLWLLFMAYSIFFSVWGVLIYLIIQVAKIRKAGRGLPAQ